MASSDPGEGEDEGAGATDDDAGLPLGEGVLPGFIRRRYAAKFLLALLVIALLVAGVGALSYLQIQDITEEDAEQTLQSSAALQSDSITEWLAGFRTQTAGLAAAPVLSGEDRGAIDAYVENATGVASADVVGVHLVDRDSGRILSSSTPDRSGGSVDDRSPAWRDAIEASAEGGVGTSDAAFERNGRLLMAFASEIGDGERVLVVVGDIGQDIEQLHRTRAVVTTRVLNPDGLGVFEPRQNTPSGLVDEPAFQAALDGETRIIQRETDVLALSPIAGTDWVVVTEAPQSELYAASRTVGRNVLILIGATILALAVVGTVVARRTVGPIVALRDKARAMEAGDLDVDLSTGRDDEIGRLYVAFANMRDALQAQIGAAEDARDQAEAAQQKLERQNDRLEEFAATVSHDLRNPLNVADAQRELAAMELAEDDPDREAIEERLAAIGDAHVRLEGIIVDVLALARGEQPVQDVETVDLSSAARDAWENVETGEATLDVAGEQSFTADRSRLLRALENLFRNAVEHGGPDVTVTVAATETGFTVTDDGPGIPADVAEDVFAHGYSGTEEGTGLGLAIVRTIATAHGWTVRLDEEYDDGARFVFEDVDGV